MDLKAVTRFDKTSEFEERVLPHLKAAHEAAAEAGIPLVMVATRSVEEGGGTVSASITAPPGTNLNPVQGVVNLIASHGTESLHEMLLTLAACVEILMDPDGIFAVDTLEQAAERERLSCAGEA